jgi:hypothetical protein
MRRSLASFGDDLARALRVWRAYPQLPLLSLLLWTTPAFADVDSSFVVALLLLPVLLFGIGWSGTECSWYAHAFTGKDLHLRAVWWLTWSYFGRFFGLAVLGALVLLLVAALAFTSGGSGAALFLVAGAFGATVLTFVTPALAFTTPSPGGAIQIGLGTLRETWPRSAPYALFPAVLILLAAPLAAADPVAGSAPQAVLALVHLAANGAATSCYLRLVGGARPAEPRPEDRPPPTRARTYANARQKRDRSTGTAIARDLAGCMILLVIFVVGIAFTGSYGFQRPTRPEPDHTLAMIAGSLALLCSIVLFVRALIRSVMRLFR